MRFLVLALFLATIAMAAEYKAGTARLDITPAGPIRMAGYAAREKPSESVAMRLHAKALAIHTAAAERTIGNHKSARATIGILLRDQGFQVRLCPSPLTRLHAGNNVPPEGLILVGSGEKPAVSTGYPPI